MYLLSTRRSAQLSARFCFMSRAWASNSTFQVEERHFYPVYVHHLSKVALEYMQNEQSQWIVEHKLEKGLRLNPDGTFVIHFPAQNGRIW
jgi:hypothetical protein